MSILQSALLGLIQGICEFLPVSSSGHLLLARILLGIQEDTPALKMLDILLHVGTLLPVIIVFWKDWIAMISHPIRNKTLLLLILASVPTLLIYLGAKVLFSNVGGSGKAGFAAFDSGWLLGVCFLVTAMLLLITDRVNRSRKRKKSEPGPGNAVVMGLFQGIGMLPGISRSGSTIAGGVFTGLSKSAAAKFSFMMSAPAIVGSLLMEGKDAIEEGYLSEIEMVPTLVGILIAAVSGFLAIRFMLKIISKVPMGWFALYLAILGVVYLALQLSGSSLVPPFAIPAAAAGI